MRHKTSSPHIYTLQRVLTALGGEDRRRFSNPSQAGICSGNQWWCWANGTNPDRDLKPLQNRQILELSQEKAKPPHTTNSYKIEELHKLIIGSKHHSLCGLCTSRGKGMFCWLAFLLSANLQNKPGGFFLLLLLSFSLFSLVFPLTHHRKAGRLLPFAPKYLRRCPDGA